MIQMSYVTVICMHKIMHNYGVIVNGRTGGGCKGFHLHNYDTNLFNVEHLSLSK